MKLLQTYFWKTLPIGALIWLAPIWLAWAQISQPTSNHLKSIHKNIPATKRIKTLNIRSWDVFVDFPPDNHILHRTPRQCLRFCGSGWFQSKKDWNSTHDYGAKISIQIWLVTRIFTFWIIWSKNWPAVSEKPVGGGGCPRVPGEGVRHLMIWFHIFCQSFPSFCTVFMAILVLKGLSLYPIWPVSVDYEWVSLRLSEYL